MARIETNCKNERKNFYVVEKKYENIQLSWLTKKCGTRLDITPGLEGKNSSREKVE